MGILLILAFIIKKKISTKHIFILGNLGTFQVIVKKIYIFNIVSMNAFWVPTIC